MKVVGGGVSGQAGAVRHGLARALVRLDEAIKPATAQGWLPHARPAHEGTQEVRPQARPQGAAVHQALIAPGAARTNDTLRRSGRGYFALLKYPFCLGCCALT